MFGRLLMAESAVRQVHPALRYLLKPLALVRLTGPPVGWLRRATGASACSRRWWGLAWCPLAWAVSACWPQPALAQDGPPRFTVKAFHITGATLVDNDSLQAALAPWLNKPITLLHLQHAARTMADVYRAKGWPMRPQVPVQDVVDGQVHFGVVETRLLDAAQADRHLADLALMARHRDLSSSSPPPPAMVLAALTRPDSRPDAGGLWREQQRDDATRQPAPQPSKPLPAPPDDTPATASKGPSFAVKGFRFTGVSLINEAALQLALQRWLNRPLVFADLQTATQAVADVYRSQGWLARPQIPAQDLVDGVVHISVVEARLGEVRVDDGGMALRFDKGRLLATMQARQQPDQPLNLRDVERAVQLLNNTPGLRVEATLVPGSAAGQTDVQVRAQDQPLLSGQATLDNQGARSTGTTRAVASVAVRDATGSGDEWVLNGQSTGPGNFSAGLNASLPVGYDGWRIAAQLSTLQYRLRGEFAASQAQGSAHTASVQLRYPLSRSVALSLGVERRRYINDANEEQISNKRLHSLSASLSGDGAAWWPQDAGFTQWSVSALAGEVDLSANAAHAQADAAGPRSAGRYSRLSFALSRAQPLTAAAQLFFSLSGQRASKNLDSADKFSLGGVNGVRAYPGLEGTGDSGWLGSMEWRQALAATFQLTAFYDHGQVQAHQQADFAGAPAVNRITLKGVGLGANLSPAPRISLRVQVARSVGVNPLAHPVTGVDSDGSQSLFRTWLSFNYLF
jgi:hemolysin activation/secretion protein